MATMAPALRDQFRHQKRIAGYSDEDGERQRPGLTGGNRLSPAAWTVLLPI